MIECEQRQIMDKIGGTAGEICPMNDYGKNDGCSFGADPESITYLTEQNRILTEQCRELTLLSNELKTRLAEVTEQLLQSENARQTDSARLGDALLQTQNIKFEIERLAREEAKKVIDAAKTKAEGILAEIKSRGAKVRNQLDEELIKMAQIGKEILADVASSRQSTQDAYGKIEDEVRKFITLIAEYRSGLVPAEISGPKKGNDYSNLEQLLKDVLPPDYPQYSNDSR